MNNTPSPTWHPIPGVDGYEANNVGAIRSVDRMVKRGEGFMRVRGRIKAQYAGQDGYWRVTISRNNTSRSHLVHRLIAITFHGHPQQGQEVRHRDGNRLNAAASNVIWGSHSENELDKHTHGTQYNSAKTHCPQGHTYSGINLVVTPTGRVCRNCRDKRVREFKSKAREARRSNPA